MFSTLLYLRKVFIQDAAAVVTEHLFTGMSHDDVSSMIEKYPNFFPFHHKVFSTEEFQTYKYQVKRDTMEMCTPERKALLEDQSYGEDTLLSRFAKVFLLFVFVCCENLKIKNNGIILFENSRLWSWRAKTGACAKRLGS